MADRSSGYVLGPKQGELRWMGETSTYFLAEGEHTDGAFTLVDERANRGTAVPLHRHAADMESFYVLEGEITLFVDGHDPVRGGPGAFAHVPGGTVHGFRVQSETARYLILTTPRHGQFYRAITLASQPDGSAPLESVAGTTIEKACEEYGVEFIGPLPEPA